jgi:phage I-like protein
MKEIMLSPIGDYPHAKGVQRVDREAIEQLVLNFNSVLSRLGRFFVGVPFYVGHPDVPGLENSFPDRRAYGWVKELIARTDGLYANVSWSKAGKELIEEGHYRFVSPFWSATRVGAHGNEPIYRPEKLISVGLTNNPNLPVLPLENQESLRISCLGRPVCVPGLEVETAEPAAYESVLNQKQKENKMQNSKREQEEQKEQKSNATSTPDGCNGANNQNRSVSSGAPEIREVLRLLELPATATMDDVRERVGKDFSSSRSETSPKGQVTTENAAPVMAFTEARELGERIGRLEKRLVAVVIDNAVSSGRIAAAQRSYWTRELAENFEEKSTELANASPALKTSARPESFAQMGDGGGEAPVRRKQLERLLKTKMDREGLSYDEAWEQVKEENPGLFASMQRPVH